MKPFGGPAGGKQGAVTGPEVTALDAAVYVIPTDAPEADGTLAWDKTTMVLVTARAGGQRGIGWSYTAAAAATVVDELLAAAVTGRDAFDVAGTAEAMARQVRNIGRPGIAAMAISAVDIALWDLKARLLGVALSGLLGRAHDAVPVYGSGGFTSYPDERTRDQPPRCRTCGTWSTSTTISGSNGRCSTAPWTRTAAPCARTRTARDTGWSCATPTPSLSGGGDRR